MSEGVCKKCTKEIFVHLRSTGNHASSSCSLHACKSALAVHFARAKFLEAEEVGALFLSCHHFSSGPRASSRGLEQKQNRFFWSHFCDFFFKLLHKCCITNQLLLLVLLLLNNNSFMAAGLPHKKAFSNLCSHN
jgi:hypothetical protein